VSVVGVVKRFGSTTALAGVDLEVPEGMVFGLLGPNGAGKTTLVRILATLLEPDSGRAELLGHDVVADPRTARELLALTGQFAAVDELLTGRENLEMFGRLFHLSQADARRRADELLERFDLADAADRTAKTYSGGMRRRLDLASSLLTQPRVLFLDEPTTGLDPRSRSEIWEIVRDLRREGTTILLTTQYLEEADQLADEIAVIDHGRVIAEGTGNELKDRVGGQILEVELSDVAQRDKAEAALLRVGCGAPEPDERPNRLTLPAPREGLVLVDALTVRGAEAAQSAGFVLLFPLVFASSVFVPISSMPDWLQPIARVTPVTLTANAARSLALTGGVPDSLGSALAWIVGILAVFVPLSVWRYRRMS
jgi:daunorubicin resistance ABC transporter ATP-binding subunit